MKVDVREKLEIYSPVGYSPLIVVLCHHPMLAPGPSPDPPKCSLIHFSLTSFPVVQHFMLPPDPLPKYMLKYRVQAVTHYHYQFIINGTEI